jgi:hypothetical protein
MGGRRQQTLDEREADAQFRALVFRIFEPAATLGLMLIGALLSPLVRRT